MDLSHLFQQEGKQIAKSKGEHIFRQGDVDKSLYFIHSGLLKAYYTGEDGKESVKSFLTPMNIIGNLTSAYLDERCSFSLVCLEPSVLYEIPLSTVTDYSRRDLEIANHLIESLLRLAVKKEIREYEFLCLSAENRFRTLMEKSPDLLKRVSQNDIARYLGITPVGLSRIKNRLLKKKTSESDHGLPL